MSHDHDHDDEISPQEMLLHAGSKAISNLVSAPFETTKILLQVQNRTSTESSTDSTNDAGDADTDPLWTLTGQGNAFRTVPFGQWWKANASRAAAEMIQSLLETSIRTTIDPGPELEEIMVLDRVTNSPVTIEVIPEPPLDALALTANIAGAAISGLVINPLELIHARLVVQRRVNGRLYYSDVVRAVTRIYEEEGVAGFFAGAVPTMIYYAVHTIMSDMGDQILEELLGFAPEDNPLLFGLCDFAWHLVRLGIQLPLETVRRRLYIQGAVQRGMPTVVRTTSRSTPYKDSVDVVSRIIAEEGPGSLYAGFLTQFTFTSTLICAYYSFGAFNLA
eukprot:comp18622_c0_seq1/m.20212 comp18622_c0_seq1/g.20212  ORF comp18622_c0_seq1/g.20212 comp18622_c0_seq1/m.20212 type:complete len:334 (-) comp18622_c0_seq1:128-1129(-)